MTPDPLEKEIWRRLEEAGIVGEGEGEPTGYAHFARTSPSVVLLTPNRFADEDLGEATAWCHRVAAFLREQDLGFARVEVHERDDPAKTWLPHVVLVLPRND